MICRHCNSDLIIHHILEDDEIPKMTNGSRIILPKCSICKNQISYTDFNAKINFDKKILLITGTAGAGKTAIGQYIESKSNYMFIDGDAIQKKVNYFARKNSEQKKDYFKDTIETAMILLALGYNVVVGYIINRDTLEYYTDVLQKHGIAPTFRVLVPNRQVCIDRDLKRECWTAGDKWVDMWYDEMKQYTNTKPYACIDNSNETLEETFINHFWELL